MVLVFILAANKHAGAAYIFYDPAAFFPSLLSYLLFGVHPSGIVFVGGFFFFYRVYLFFITTANPNIPLPLLYHLSRRRVHYADFICSVNITDFRNSNKSARVINSSENRVVYDERKTSRETRSCFRANYRRRAPNEL